jgi:hypothetical protein
VAKTTPASGPDVLDAVVQLRQMIQGAQSELGHDRLHSCGTLAVSAAVRASDLICDVALGLHSIAANHLAAQELLASVPDSAEAVANLSACLANKTAFNYHVTDMDRAQVQEVLDAALELQAEALRRLDARGWI